MVAEALLDHVALAVRDARGVFDRIARELGGRPLVGGLAEEYRGVQLAFSGGGMNLELLEPWGPPGGFVERFLRERGDGPHHLTFKVPDIRATIARAGELGFHPIGVRLDRPDWKEMFVHPREVPGVLVQVAEVGDEQGERADDDTLASGADPIDWWPPVTPGERVRAELCLVEYRTPDLARSRSVFGGLLGGVERAGRDGIEFTWPNGARLAVTVVASDPGVARLVFTASGAVGDLLVAGSQISIVPASAAGSGPGRP
jgi:catechol 2,3-dioxygenase-like lactoylglutathione lyase family enzyme